MIFVIDIILTTNSPGEVSSWVKPVVKKLNEYDFKKNIYVFTPPCVFSSGKENKVISQFKGITEIFSSKEYLKYILFNIRPAKFNNSNKGFVLYLGGDFMHAVFLGKKLNYPVFSYTERDYGFTKSVKKFYLSDKSIYDKLRGKGIDSSKLKVVGNLMYDSVEPQLDIEQTKKILNKKEDQILINLLPGSRPKEFKFMLPLFLNFVTEINKYKNNYRFIISKAPFIDDKEILKVLKQKNIKGKTDYYEKENIIVINETVIDIYENNLYSIMEASDFAITIPGTNNLELAVLKTPALVILALNKPELIPLPGLIGLISEIPILKKLIKRIIIPKMARNRDYISLINLVAQKDIVPELIGKIDSEGLARKVINLFDENEVEAIKKRYDKLEIKKGAANRIIEDIFSELKLETEESKE